MLAYLNFQGRWINSKKLKVKHKSEIIGLPKRINPSKN